MTLPTLELLHRDRWHTLGNVPPARTLLQVLREDDLAVLTINANWVIDRISPGADPI